MITKEAVGYGMPLGKRNKRVEEQREYKKSIKECSLCKDEVRIKDRVFGELGYIHRAYKKDGDYYEYFFLVLCADCFNAVKVVMHKLRKDAKNLHNGISTILSGERFK